MSLLSRSTTLSISSHAPKKKGISKTTIIKSATAAAFVLLTVGVLVIPRKDADFGAACAEVAESLGNEPDVCTAEYSPDNDPQPYVNNTLKDVIYHPVCVGYQKSTADQWMNPLANWVLPGLSLLLLIPTGERGVKTLSQHTLWQGVWDSFREWCKIVGDPASCFCGTFSEFTTDIRMLREDLPMADKPKDALALKVCALISQLRWTEKTGLGLMFLKGYSRSAPYGRDAMRTILGGRVRFLASVLLPVVMYSGSAFIIIYDARVAKVGDNDTSHMLAYGIWYLWLLALAVLSNCYGAHISTEAIQAALQSMLQQMTTINDPALWDMQKKAYTALLEDLHPDLLIWILQTKYNEDHGRRFNSEEDAILRKQFERDPFRLASLPCETRKLHGRYLDNLMWRRWLDGLPSDIDKPQKPLPVELPIDLPVDLPVELLDSKLDPYLEPVEDAKAVPRDAEGGEPIIQSGLQPLLDRSGLLRYILAQLVGWSPIAICCGFAATISWTTPRVSFGCRSLNHITYAICTFLCAILYAIIQYLRFNHSANRNRYPFAPEIHGPVTPTRTYRIWNPIINSIYHFLLQINSFIFLAGTVFQLSGVYRSCFCKIGILPSIQWAFNMDGWQDVPVQWGVDTRLHREMSLTVWVPLVMTAWALIATVCFGGIGLKEWILRKLRKCGSEVVEKGNLDQEVWRVDASDCEDEDGDDEEWGDAKPGCGCDQSDTSYGTEKKGYDEKTSGGTVGNCTRCGESGGVRVRVYRTTSEAS